jgi:DNA-binding NarL/FixJ family response regulator
MEKKSLDQRNLLIVDRSVFNRHQIEQSLSADQWRIAHANTGEEAVNLCRLKKFDAILMEADVFDGECVTSISVIRKGTGLCNEATIVAMADFSPGAFSTLTTQSGANLHVNKSIMFEKPHDIIEKAFSVHRSELSPPTPILGGE